MWTVWVACLLALSGIVFAVKIKKRKLVKPLRVTGSSSYRLRRDYHLLRFLGQGSFGAVLEVEAKRDEKRYAIKVINGSFDANTKEVQNWAELPGHRNVVRYDLYFEDKLTRSDLDYVKPLAGGSKISPGKFSIPFGASAQTVLCIQMELCDTDLRDWLGVQTSVELSKSCSIFRHICQGLQHIHEHGLIHRDLKPDNIFFDRSRAYVKIGDFGLAAMHSGGSSSACHTVGAGTRCYLAPEQETSKYGRKVDLYAAGLILLELCYPPMQPKERNWQKLRDCFDDLKHHGKLPEEVQQYTGVARLIKRLVSVDPHERPGFEDIYAELGDQP